MLDSFSNIRNSNDLIRFIFYIVLNSIAFLCLCFWLATAKVCSSVIVGKVFTPYQSLATG
jgi:hypothetical protein